MAEVFLSYAKPDRSHALELAEELRAHGFSVWIDQGGIGGAQNWSTEIVEAIKACSTLLLLLSSNSAQSHNVAKEVQLASEKRKNILPVVLERIELPSVLEYPLAGVQRVYFHDRPSVIHALERLYGRAKPEEALEHAPRIPNDDGAVRIAVLPFDDLSPKHDNQWFADGMMDELIATLGHLDRVKVPGRSDVLRYREHRDTSRDIARELGVRYLIEGAVRKAGKRIRINASLIDTNYHEQLWANQFDGSFDDVFAFQESVSRSITEALKLELSPREEQAIETPPTQNPEAYELYLKGRHEQYYLTKESYMKALDLYEQAAALDPAYAQAYIGIASACCVYYREYSRSPKWLERAEEAAANAEAIGGETSRTLYVRGMIEWLRGDDQAAIVTLTRSTELDPKNHNALNVLGTIHMLSGNYSAAAGAFQMVTEIMETTANYFNLLISLDGGEEQELLKQTAEKALPIFERYFIREPADYGAAVSFGYVQLWAGKKEDAINTAAQLLELHNLQGITLYNLGCLYDSLGKPEVYIVLLRKAIEHGYREIEQTRQYQFQTKDPQCVSEFYILLDELEQLVEKEKAVNSF